MRKTENLIGKRFTRLIVVKRDYSTNKTDAVWECICDCGNTTQVTSNKLRGYKTKSCGCYGAELKLKHGLNGSPEYHAWENLIQRCINSKHPSFKRYGARGILVCVRWMGKDGFTNFISDMGFRPSSKHSIDRRDNDKGYSPENCYWATKKEQANNSRNCVLILDVEAGVFYTTIKDAATSIGIEREKLSYLLRYNKIKKFVRT